jgi:DNA-binding LytR/AlgR family response regulator
MVRRLWRALRSPYPYECAAASDLLYGLACGFFVTLFFFAFEPFGFSPVPAAPRRLLFAGYGAITFLAIVANGRLLPRLAPRFFREEGWTILRQVALMCWVTLLIGVASFALTGFVFRRHGLTTRWVRLWPIVLSAFFIAAIPITVIILMSYARLLRRSALAVSEANRRLERPAAPPPGKAAAAPPLEIVAENGRDRLRVALADLLFIQAEENYVQVHHKDEKHGRVLLRSSMARMERQLRPFYPRLFRCHRAFIVNTSQIAKVDGNAQGLKLTLKDAAAVIPVARRYVGEFRRIVRGL